MRNTDTVMAKMELVLGGKKETLNTAVLRELLSELLASTVQDINDASSNGHNATAIHLGGKLELIRDLKTILS